MAPVTTYMLKLLVTWPVIFFIMVLSNPKACESLCCSGLRILYSLEKTTLPRNGRSSVVVKLHVGEWVGGRGCVELENNHFKDNRVREIKD